MNSFMAAPIINFNQHHIPYRTIMYVKPSPCPLDCGNADTLHAYTGKFAVQTEYGLGYMNEHVCMVCLKSNIEFSGFQRLDSTPPWDFSQR